ncbi:MAG TPA: CDP-diacylglycerol--glycerol-3-phosphate 3-phosphatidyltransferase [Spirochaetales bacterium]|nr:CDP-diacylglycerol--glycerol-3-phosphate 3-phosphatidyltransferase [Spirochaetales bacterium]
MNLANALTASRLVLAPLFFAIYLWGQAVGLSDAAVAILLIILFAVMELSDLFDGMAARSSKTVSAFGKLFDPFADVVARLTYFLCFAHAGIMPLWMLLVILNREFGILFLRQLMAVKGVAMGARPGGKTKAVLYASAGGLSLLYLALPAFGFALPSWALVAVRLVYALAVALSVGSFIDYIIQFRKLNASK